MGGRTRKRLKGRRFRRKLGTVKNRGEMFKQTGKRRGGKGKST